MEDIVVFTEPISEEAKVKFEEIRNVEKKMREMQAKLVEYSSVKSHLQEEYRKLCPPLIVNINKKRKCVNCNGSIELKGLPVKTKQICPHCGTQYGIFVNSRGNIDIYSW